ncbi:MAG: PilZ domain-containing protein [Acidobacteriota bacterium]
MSTDRRRVQRIRLEQPLRGHLSGMRVSVLDVSTTGARIEHSFPLSTDRTLRLHFIWQDQDVTLECHVTRCTTEQARGTLRVYNSGLDFVEGAGGSKRILVGMITDFVTRDLDRLKHPSPSAS